MIYEGNRSEQKGHIVRVYPINSMSHNHSEDIIVSETREGGSCRCQKPKAGQFVLQFLRSSGVDLELLLLTLAFFYGDWDLSSL